MQRGILCTETFPIVPPHTPTRIDYRREHLEVIFSPSLAISKSKSSSWGTHSGAGVVRGYLQSRRIGTTRFLRIKAADHSRKPSYFLNSVGKEAPTPPKTTQSRSWRPSHAMYCISNPHGARNANFAFVHGACRAGVIGRPMFQAIGRAGTGMGQA